MRAQRVARRCLRGQAPPSSVPASMSLETIEREFVLKSAEPRLVYDVVTDYACYPRIFPEFTGSRVLRTEGVLKRVEFRARVMIEVRYVLDIVHDEGKLSTRWTYVEGEVVSDSEGGWSFSAVPGGTLVKYRAGIAVKAPLPKFVVNKVSNALVGTSIPNMFRALERETLARRKYAE